MGKRRIPRRADTKRKRRVSGGGDRSGYAKASDVVVTRADGTTEVQAALTPAEYQRMVKTRTVTPQQRARILRRDRGRCRYCGGSDSPMHVDHVVPIALGGSNRDRNLVTACPDCNQRKGADVWKPRPL